MAMTIELKPLKSLQQLNKQIGDNQVFSLNDFLDFCFHVIENFEANQYQQLDEKAITSINTYPVSSQKTHSLIYYYLSETFCSLVQAYYDEDAELLEAEVKEIKETILEFWSKSNESYEEYYQNVKKFPTGSAQMKIQKQSLINKTVIFFYERKKSVEIRVNSDQINEEREINSELIEKEQKLEKRKKQRIMPLMQCTLGNFRNISPLEGQQKRNQIQQNRFVFRNIIQLCQQ